MIKIYCDRCGIEVGELEAYTLHINGPEIVSWDDQFMYSKTSWHLCKDCFTKIWKSVKFGE